MRQRENVVRLRVLMREYDLTRQAVADRLGVSIDTVHSWLKPADNRSHRSMPARQLRLLELELGLADSRP